MKHIVDDLIKPRLPNGALYRKMRGYYGLKNRSDIPFTDDMFLKNVLKRLKIFRDMYFFSSFFVKNALRDFKDNFFSNFYEWLSDNYTSSEDDSLFDFNGVIISKPACDRDSSSFAFECVDNILPHLIQDREVRKLCEVFYCEGPYEYGNVILQNGDVVIDAGANIGLFSGLASRKCCKGSGGIIWSFEPVPDNITLLKSTAALNGGINVMPFGLTDTIGSAIMTLSKSLTGNTMVLGIDSDVTIEVRTTTLDFFVHENNLQKVDFIKADIEGAERLMLKGARQVLRDFAPKLALCTYHLPDDPQILRELILDANPNYVIVEKWKKMYAYVPRILD